MSLSELKKIVEKAMNSFENVIIPVDDLNELISKYEKAVEALRYVIEHSQPNTYNNEKARQTLKELGEVE